ncbi:MAG: sulfite exporter TauE/SafE family protein, partial [Succinivibrio sp.]
ISGLPIHQALATNKMSAMMGTAVTTVRYALRGYIDFKKAIFCVILAFTGSAIGAKLALLIPETPFKIALIAVLPLTAFYLLRKKNFGSAKGDDTIGFKASLLCSLVSFAVGIYDGVYGPGTGTFLIIGFCTFAGCSIQKANGLTKAVNLTTNIAAFTVFMCHGSVLVLLGLTAGIFSILGNMAGAMFFERKGTIGTRPVLIFVIGLFMAKTVFELVFK